MLYLIGRLILKISGIRFYGDYPYHLNKHVIIVVPHTSNWDFVIGASIKYTERIKTNYIGKDSLFRFPLGYLFRYLGGVPVDRTKSNKLVDQIVDIYNKREKFVLALAPEGTRKKVDRLKTGFYYIAKKANVPITMVRFDYPNKRVEVAKPFYTTESKEDDFAKINEFFKDIQGKIPENSYIP